MGAMALWLCRTEPPNVSLWLLCMTPLLPLRLLNCFCNVWCLSLVCHIRSYLTGTHVFCPSFGNMSSLAWAPNWFIAPPTIPKPMVKLNVHIGSLSRFFVASFWRNLPRPGANTCACANWHSTAPNPPPPADPQTTWPSAKKWTNPLTYCLATAATCPPRKTWWPTFMTSWSWLVTAWPAPSSGRSNTSTSITRRWILVWGSWYYSVPNTWGCRVRGSWPNDG